MSGSTPDGRSRSVSSQAAGRWDALSLAIAAHEGQTDKGGAAYIGHCLHVAGRAYEAALAEGQTADFALRCYRVGLLHDVLEDCEWATLEMVEEAIGAVDLVSVIRLTKDGDESRSAYIRSIAHDPIACTVKRCDLAHNMDLRRIPAPTQKDLTRREKYRRELDFLKEAARADSEAPNV